MAPGSLGSSRSPPDLNKSVFALPVTVFANGMGSYFWQSSRAYVPGATCKSPHLPCDFCIIFRIASWLNGRRRGRRGGGRGHPHREALGALGLAHQHERVRRGKHAAHAKAALSGGRAPGGLGPPAIVAGGGAGAGGAGAAAAGAGAGGGARRVCYPGPEGAARGVPRPPVGPAWGRRFESSNRRRQKQEATRKRNSTSS